MSESTENIIIPDGTKPKNKSGIKSFTFTASGNNGESHRRNYVKKHRQYLKNRETRAQLYMQRGTMHEKDWHSQLNALSQGTAG